MNSGIDGALAIMIIGSFLAAMLLHETGHALTSFCFSRGGQGIDKRSLHLRPRLDVMGTIFCILLAFQPLFPVGLGWGKPLRDDTWMMQRVPRTSRSIVALAGPLLNFIIGLLVALIMRFASPYLLGFDTLFAQRLLQIMLVFASVNICLAIFNMIPLYPLDGYQIVRSLLPGRAAAAFTKTAFFGLVVVLVLFFVLPFMAQLTGGSSIPLFRLPSYVLSESFHLIAAMIGSFPTNLDLVRGLYFS